MKICRFNENRLGLVEGSDVIDITFALEALGAPGWPYPAGDWVVANFERLLPAIRGLQAPVTRYKLDKVKLLAPIANPGKIIGAPINYRDHIDEANADKEINHGKTYTTLDQYGLFLKANTSLEGPNAIVQYPFPDRRTDHEVELGVVIGKRGRRITRDNALDHVFGYCVALDMTVRGPEFPGFRKSADGFGVIGPWVTTRDEVRDPNALDLRLTVNGEQRQASNTRFLIFDVQRLVEYASAMYTLEPGDIIMTGTPSGVGPVKPGDLVEATVEGLGALSVRMAAD